MDVVLVGPGRAGLALSIRLAESGHSVVGVLARDGAAAQAAAQRLDTVPLSWDAALPGAALLVLAVRDDAIAGVAERLAGHTSEIDGAVHLSGMTPIDVLRPLGDRPIGSFHPLQTLPDPEVGADRLAGAWAGITASDDLFADRLFALAHSIGMHPFEVTDDAKPLYHAAAAAAANVPLAALAMSERLFAAAGIPFEAAAPLIDAVIANALEMGPTAALTGPVARGDVGTVRSQVVAVEATIPELLEDFVAAARAVARVAGTSEIIDEALT